MNFVITFDIKNTIVYIKLVFLHEICLIDAAGIVGHKNHSPNESPWTNDLKYSPTILWISWVFLIICN